MRRTVPLTAEIMSEASTPAGEGFDSKDGCCCTRCTQTWSQKLLKEHQVGLNMMASKSTPDIASTRRHTMATIRKRSAAARPVRTRSSHAPGTAPAAGEV